MSKEAMKLALEALGNTWTEPGNKQYEIEKEAITALREALAEQPAQQEPEKDWDAVGQAHLAALKKSSKKLVEEAAVRTAHKMAQQQESVAILEDLEQEIYENTREFVSRNVMEWMLKRYYTSPPAQRTWVGLTNVEIEARAINFYNPEMYKRAVLWAQEKLKERNQ